MTDDLLKIDDGDLGAGDFDALRASHLVDGWFLEFDAGVMAQGVPKAVVAERLDFQDADLDNPAVPEVVRDNARTPLLNAASLQAAEQSTELGFQMAYQRNVALTVWCARFMALARLGRVAPAFYETILNYADQQNTMVELLEYAKNSLEKKAGNAAAQS